MIERDKIMHPLVKRIIQEMSPTEFLVELKDGTRSYWTCGDDTGETFLVDSLK